MTNYFKKIVEKRRLRKLFSEYGYEVNKFSLPETGEVEYAQWLHPFEGKKEITESNVSFYRSLAQPGSMIIDIGAHTGDTTVPMALAVGKDGLVLGLEPNPYVFKILEKNASLNPSKTSIIPLCFAATETNGRFEFSYSDASFCNGGFLSQIESDNHRHNFKLEVEGRNLEKFLLANYADRLSSLQLIKIDAEGYDKEILKTIPEIVNRFRPKLMIECYKKLTVQERLELFDIVDAYGYELYHLENFEVQGKRDLILRKDMNKLKHFEMLALPRIS